MGRKQNQQKSITRGRPRMEHSLEHKSTAQNREFGSISLGIYCVLNRNEQLACQGIRRSAPATKSRVQPQIQDNSQARVNLGLSLLEALPVNGCDGGA